MRRATDVVEVPKICKNKRKIPSQQKSTPSQSFFDNNDDNNNNNAFLTNGDKSQAK